MSEEKIQIILTMLKQAVEVITDFMDDESRNAKNLELTQYIESSIDYITREGIRLDENSTSDLQLVSMYATWLYDKRKTTGSKYTSYYIQNMPRMLRYNLNNRLMQEKVRDNDS